MTPTPDSKAEHDVVSTAEYRRLTGDILTPDDLVARRLRFLERLCRSIIRSTLQEHANKDQIAITKTASTRG
ncbi:MAG: hypothetical protein KBD24_04120 [Candidatus Pacebacteria bacterium]|nr:hypothetical protein [Candidatus Paceibacterota bacterium]